MSTIGPVSGPCQGVVIAAKVDAGQLRVDVSNSYPLPDIGLVHEQSAAGKIRGKVVLIPGA